MKLIAKKLYEKLETYLLNKHGIRLGGLLAALGMSTAIGLLQYLYILLIY